jgi:hypothetical protein
MFRYDLTLNSIHHVVFDRIQDTSSKSTFKMAVVLYYSHCLIEEINVITIWDIQSFTEATI